LIELPDADVRLWSRAFGPTEADFQLRTLRDEIKWQQEEIVLFGRRHLVPRLVAWHGDPGSAYSYSGTAHEPSPWTPTLIAIRQRIEALTGHTFNSVLLNLYRNGSDGMGWHADDEPELGRNPVIASVSFGATRRFKLRHRKRRDSVTTLELTHGSLLLMAGNTQHAYVHAVPKTAVVSGERINLTYRCALNRPPVARSCFARRAMYAWMSRTSCAVTRSDICGMPAP
jgi:alkylated DNA repair dioxygenase AlkB